MKKSCFLVFTILFAFNANSQFEKTLLWEISGNGLKKKSYVYGTFHVNEKISYHLSDAFYKHLLEADIVSNESNPDSWGELFDLYMNFRIPQKPKFYSNFSLKPVTKQDLLPLFMSYNFFNQMSSGVEGRQADYSENTVLDMFIYQTAKKYNKKTIGLEDAKKSFITMRKLENVTQVLDADKENTEENEEKKALLTKILKGKSIYMTLRDFYREKDIVMLDSLSKLSEKPEKHKIMIIDRNYDMVKSIDSLVHQGSLFSAVGAAHLGGKEGVLQLLINKGYKLTPVLGPLTKKGETDKKTIEEYFPNPKSKSEPTTDKMVQAVDFDLTFSFDKIKSTLDITNGGVLSMVRVPLRNYMKKKNEYFNYKSIDSLLYEFIPGEILEKKEFKEDSYIGYDIKNKSKAGNFQHYRFYVTPLEIISFCFIGSGAYVKQYEQSVYDKLKIKGFKNTWEKVRPQKGGFSVLMPEFAVQYGNNEKLISDVTFEAYDPLEKSYFFLIENTSLDMDFLDDKIFQHQQIQNEFYMNQEMKETAQFDETTNEYISTSTSDHHKVKLKSIIRGNKFYLMGAVDASEESNTKFFDSFSFEPFAASESTVYQDTLGKYKIEIPKKINEQKILGISNDDVRYGRRWKKNPELDFQPKEFESHTGQTVSVDIMNYPRYFQVTTMDSLKIGYNEDLKELFDKPLYNIDNTDPFLSTWNNYFKEPEKTEVVSNIFSHDSSIDCEVADAIVSVKNSDQALKLRTFFTNSHKITLKSLVDRNYKNDDPFIEKAFATFVPEKINDRSIFDDKIKLFLEEAKSDTDSIRKIAFSNVYSISLKETDFDRITNFLDTFEFKDSDLNGKSLLYEKLGSLKHPKVVSYLENKYKAQGTKTTEQLSILTALASQNTENSYRLVLKLMDYDLPVTEDTYELSELFEIFNKNIETSKVLFPDIFQFYGIEEYNELIVQFCNKVLEKKLGSPKKIAAFQKLILTHSKLEYKRTLNREEKKAASEGNEYEEYYTSFDEEENPNNNLINYLSLLSYMPKNTGVSELIEKIKKLDNPEIQLDILKLEITRNKATKESIKKVLENPKTKFKTILLLQNNDDFGLLEDIADDEIAEAAMKYFDKIKDNSKVQFLEKRKIKKGTHEAVFYFYQTQNMKDGKPIGTKLFNSMAFLIDNNKIVPRAFFSPVLEEINEDNTVEILIPAVMKETIYQDHPGASFRKKQNFENMFNYEE